MTPEQKALEILRAMAETAAAGNSLTIADDWGFGTATLISRVLYIRVRSAMLIS